MYNSLEGNNNGRIEKLLESFNNKVLETVIAFCLLNSDKNIENKDELEKKIHNLKHLLINLSKQLEEFEKRGVKEENEKENKRNEESIINAEKKNSNSYSERLEKEEAEIEGLEGAVVGFRNLVKELQGKLGSDDQSSNANLYPLVNGLKQVMITNLSNDKLPESVKNNKEISNLIDTGIFTNVNKILNIITNNNINNEKIKYELIEESNCLQKNLKNLYGLLEKQIIKNRFNELSDNIKYLQDDDKIKKIQTLVAAFGTVIKEREKDLENKEYNIINNKPYLYNLLYRNNKGKLSKLRFRGKIY